MHALAWLLAHGKVYALHTQFVCWYGSCAGSWCSWCAGQWQRGWKMCQNSAGFILSGQHAGDIMILVSRIHKHTTVDVPQGALQAVITSRRGFFTRRNQPPGHASPIRCKVQRLKDSCQRQRTSTRLSACMPFDLDLGHKLAELLGGLGTR